MSTIFPENNSPRKKEHRNSFVRVHLHRFQPQCGRTTPYLMMLWSYAVYVVPLLRGARNVVCDAHFECIVLLLARFKVDN
jgi:hypothetical protein